jgi:hypothetical protein
MTTIKGIEYTIRHSEFADCNMLMKNGKPVLLIPEELEEDFIQLLVYAGAAARFLNETETKLQTNKTETE